MSKYKLPKTKFPIKNIKQFSQIFDIDDINDEAIVERKQFFLEDLKIEDGEEKTIVANVSLKLPDSDGDLVIPEGASLTRFIKNSIVYWNHNHNSLPIGRATQVQVNEDGIQMKLLFANTDFANDVWMLLRDKFLKACSLGFIVKKSLTRGTSAFKNFIKEKGLEVSNSVDRIITEFEIFENSIVGLPALEDALTVALSEKSLTLSDETMKELKMVKLEVKEGDEKTDEVEGVNEVATEILEEEAKKEVEELVEEPVEYEMIDPVDPEVEKILVEMRDNEIAAEFEVIEVVPELPELKSVVRSGDVDIKREISNYTKKRKGKII